MSEAWSPQAAFATSAPVAFAAGFAGRHDDIGDALRRAFSPPPGFAPTPPGNREPEQDLSPAEEAAPEPRHFHPADRENKPTEGWDPFSAAAASVDAVATARAEGYAEGLREAREEAAIDRNRDRALLDGLAQALSSVTWLDRERFATQMRQTVLTLVSQLIGETGVSADNLNARIEAAVELLADSTESAILRLNPADMALVDGRLPATVFAVADADMARGAFSLEAASTIVEDSPERWIEQLTAAIDRVPLPKC
ncbi:FliH/SctL family protein [Sphingomonas sp. IW22]|uniref:FliH/SctL family protein n=1 Tax=Sphingomonas sp. IW22 TaxID=3242489 RepID=UPI00351F99E8